MPTPEQERKVMDVAIRFGCWPNDVVTSHRGELLDVTIGVHKGRPKHLTLDPKGRTIATGRG
jgi:hypothetical protein